MKKLFVVSALLFFSTQTANAAEPGYIFNQITHAQGKQLVSITPHAVSIMLPLQKYRIYSFAPKWNVIYINDQIGTYIDFPHDKFLGSIIGRLGNQLANDVQMMPLQKPQMVCERGMNYVLYNQKFGIRKEDRKRLQEFSSGKYSLLSYTGKYLRLPDYPKEAKETVCKVSCAPMSSDFPLKFSGTNGFAEVLDVIETAQVRKESNITITPPDLKNLKRVTTEPELFSKTRMSDVFELLGDEPGAKKTKPGAGK